MVSFINTSIVLLTHQALVVWKLAQPQTGGPWYIHGPVHIHSYFKFQPLSSGSHVFLY